MKRIIISSSILACLFIGASSKVVKGYQSASDDTMAFRVDSIDYRADLTRVYGKLVGRPHTSNRIDEVSFTSTTSMSTSTDIDGVDFRRYFQWEDDGLIPIEIDFPAMKPTNDAQILFMTAHGPATTTVKKNSSHHK